MRSLLTWLVIAVVLAGAGYAGWRWYNERQGVGSSAYRTAPVRRADIVSSISATGTVVPEEVVDVGAQINGQIASFGLDKDGKSVDYRSTVDEGMVLAKIDDALYAADVSTANAQLDQATARVKVAQASRDEAQAKLYQAQRDWERAQRLGQSRALSQSDYDASKSAFEQANASLALAEATIGQENASVEIAKASLLRADRNLKYCTIYSPVNGVIIDRRVDIGQTVVASLNAPSLFLIAQDLTRMMVLVQVNEADIGHVQPGEKVTFTTDAFPGEVFHGDVRKVRLNATMTQNVVTYTVEILTENKDQKLLPYLTANVKFEIARRDDVLAVPNAALRWSPTTGPEATPAPRGDAAPGRAEGKGAPGGGQGEGKARTRGGRESRGEERSQTSTVWVLTDGVAHAVKVKPGLSDGALTEVDSEDLKEGDEVVIGDAIAGASAGAAANATRSPFAPPPMPGGGRRGR